MSRPAARARVAAARVISRFDRRLGRSFPRAAVCLLVGLLAAATAVRAEDLGFVRVNVPPGGLREVPLAGGRYVPMPVAEPETRFRFASVNTGREGVSERICGPLLKMDVPVTLSVPPT